MRIVHYIKADGIDHGIDFDARFKVKRWPAVAVFPIGFYAEYESVELEDSEDFELVPDYTRVVAIMVGDDRKHIVDASDLIQIDELDYCAVCGQLGCNHDGRERL